MEDVGMPVLLPFGIYVGHFDIFSHFGILYQEKSGNPGLFFQPESLLISFFCFFFQKTRTHNDHLLRDLMPGLSDFISTAFSN
jgi:hypothetical protein